MNFINFLFKLLKNDCWDNSDEMDCKTKISSKQDCPKDAFKCRNGHCIPMSWVCDRDNDCDDGNKTTISSDEEKCDYVCESDQFKCNNSDCIPMIWR